MTINVFDLEDEGPVGDPLTRMCPTCAALPGEPCTTGPAFGEMPGYHTERTRAPVWVAATSVQHQHMWQCFTFADLQKARKSS